MSGSMQGLFLRAHTALHPEGAAMKDLLASGVSERRVISLYPYELRDWLPALIVNQLRLNDQQEQQPAFVPGREAMWRSVGVGDLEMHARMRGIEEDVRRLPGHQQNVLWATGLADRCLEVLSTSEGASWLAAMGFTYADASALAPLASTISVLDELTTTASRWSDFPELHEYDEQWRPYIEASLAVLMPSEFKLDRPPVRYDTMMFR